MSLPEELALRTRESVISRLSATERTGADGGPLLSLSSPFSDEPVGEMRVYSSAAVPKIVYARLTVAKFGMDTHMIFAFTPPESAVPHFTLDSVHANGTLAFHLDLIPRAELATHVPYMDAAYGGITGTYTDTSAWEGLTKAHLTPRQYAMMSPWMLANRADEPSFKAMDDVVAAYADHWFGLVENGLPAEVTTGLDPAELSRRDADLRHNLFSPEVDPVWRDAGKIVGEDAAETMRQMLTSNDT